jgi:hypothetical protein
MAGQRDRPLAAVRLRRGRGVSARRPPVEVRELAARFGLEPDELNLDLGPLGRLL